MNKYLNIIIRSMAAGLFIGLAAVLYLKTDNKIIGAVLFSIGLISCFIGNSFLFTGKIGFVKNKEDLINVILGISFNALVAVIVGLIYKALFGSIPVMASRLNKSIVTIVFDGIGCGMLIHLAVLFYNKESNWIVVILPVVAFILAGFEHVVADFVYLAIDFSWMGLLYIVLVGIGNSVGAWIINAFYELSKLN